MAGRLILFPQLSGSSDDGDRAARRVLETPIEERSARATELALEEPEVLLSLAGIVHEMLHSEADLARREAEFFYRLVEHAKHPIGLFDERDYFLGEFALMAGTACRQLSLRDEARLWFDRSEAGYRQTVNAICDLSRLSYQRLALRLEERQLDAVLEMAPGLAKAFEKLGMQEDEIKARFLQGLALMESDLLAEAVGEFDIVISLASRIRSERLVAQGYANLTHIYGLMGDSENAIRCSQLAIPVLERLGDRFALAKVRWGLANLLRKRGQVADAIEAYRTAQMGFAQIGMKADVAALNLVVADLQLETGDEAGAMKSILGALPVIDELKMVPEGMAAMTLLQESVRQQKINRGALRDLHGFFDEVQGR